jgi:protein-L-isoaspartate O-methyltransferase
MSTTTTSGTAAIQGELWGARAREFAEEQEPQSRPLYEHALRRLRIGEGTAVLDVGCGSGFFCRLAADAGARVSGIDAAGPLVEIAKGRVPTATSASAIFSLFPSPTTPSTPSPRSPSKARSRRS